MEALVEINKLITFYAKFMVIFLWYQTKIIIQWLLPRSLYAKNVQEDVVLITGAGSGLGRAIALEYAKLKSSLILWDINEDGLRETKKLVELEYEKFANTLNEKRVCLTYYADVSDKAQVYELAEKVSQDLNVGRGSGERERYVSVLVNNAGIYHGLMLQELKDEQIERIFKINILAHFWTVRAFLPNMMKHERGHIVEIASMGGQMGLHKQVDYCATKFASVGFEESLSIELDCLGYSEKIHTTVICPFFFSSNLFTGYDSRVSSLMTSEYVAKETVMAMRCNHSRMLLPKLSAYFIYTIKCLSSRQFIIYSTKMLGLADGIKGIKGRAAAY